jgi:hypothetical protein
MIGDTSFYDTCTKIWGQNLEKAPEEYKQELLSELTSLYEVGGCFEDEGFVPVKCADGNFTIKPMHWFRSRIECEALIEFCKS